MSNDTGVIHDPRNTIMTKQEKEYALKTYDKFVGLLFEKLNAVFIHNEP